MTATNDVTGDKIVNSKGDNNKYRSGFDLIDWSKDAKQERTTTENKPCSQQS